ncbi:transposase-like protein, IS1515 [Streptococcus pneumoniae]|nr:transposase-like protein, IS1515 [Streptococcus pneumoniae]VKM79008.1 transposase-like protein, IS1515 [Streptococcus pneumoniae]VNA89173.1 transposase-like protein, IS1515 [Streptococcus pneumoniae]VNR15765.1 transposase-like protein, IS1515 [Streptococcus pneumoniae]VPE34390.1 transposase-like protein, IS1515 [Streptococcus pneumoniae]
MLIGQKIKEIRIEKGISRPDFCGDEQELTVRQLSRIESGASQPSLPKLAYIARRLEFQFIALCRIFQLFLLLI